MVDDLGCDAAVSCSPTAAAPAGSPRSTESVECDDLVPALFAGAPRGSSRQNLKPPSLGSAHGLETTPGDAPGADGAQLGREAVCLEMTRGR